MPNVREPPGALLSPVHRSSSHNSAGTCDLLLRAAAVWTSARHDFCHSQHYCRQRCWLDFAHSLWLQVLPRAQSHRSTFVMSHEHMWTMCTVCQGLLALYDLKFCTDCVSALFLQLRSPIHTIFYTCHCVHNFACVNVFPIRISSHSF